MLRRLHRLVLPALAAALLLGAAQSGAEVTQHGRIRVHLDGELTPHRLPRSGEAPVSVSVGGRIATTDGLPPPQLRRLTLAINRNGVLDDSGLPACQIDEIQPSSTATAREVCGASLVGNGNFSADVILPEQSPFPSSGRVLAFFGTDHGRPAILAHVYGTKPIPTSYTLPFLISERRHGQYGTVLIASLPPVTANSGYVTGLELHLGRSFTADGTHHSFLSASCPAPTGFPGAVFPLIKASFGFAGPTLTTVLTRSCSVRGR